MVDTEVPVLRKQVLRGGPTDADARQREIDVAAVATVIVTSEEAEHPIDHVFDSRRGPGGSRWAAGEPGEQEVVLAFDTPQSLSHISLEVEERGVERRQELWLEVSCDGGRTYREVLRQEYNFSPPGTTFEREDWAVRAEGVTRLRVRIKPDMAGKPCRATLTSLAIR